MKAISIALYAAVLLAGVVPAGAADQTVQFKISHWVPPTHPLQPALEAWARDVEQESGGTIKVTIFPAEQLGKAFDHYDMARDGIADMTYVNPGYQPGRFPVIAAAELPFLFADAKGGTAAIDEWYRKYAAREMKDVHFCAAFVHDPGSFHSRKKIARPEDLRGLKVRPADATIGELVTLLGGTNVQASAPQARDVLERGVADAITFPWGSVFLFGIDKVVKFHMDAPLYVSTFVLAINTAKYDSMSPAQKKAIDDHCNTEWAVKIASPWADFEAAGRERMRKEPGHDVYKLTTEEIAAWRTAVEPLNDKWAAGARSAGYDPAEIMAALKASLEQNHAAF